MLLGPRVGIIYGGVDGERNVSVASAKTVRSILANSHYRIVDIEISQDGFLIVDGNRESIENISGIVDVALLATHGSFGEDGRLQKILEDNAIYYTGSDSVASAVAFSKSLTRNVLSAQGIKIPAGQAIQFSEIENRSPREVAQELFQTFPQPCVIKPDRAGSSSGVSVCDDIDSIAVALEKAFSIDNVVVVEEYIDGREASVGVVENIRDCELYALPPVEIIPADEKEYFDYEAKYEGASQEICPAGFDDALTKELEAIAVQCHEILQLSDYSRTDFRIHPKRGIYVLETNTLPGLTEESLLPKELEAVGISLADFFDHLIKQNLPFDFSE